MNIVDFLTELRKLDIQLSLNGENLRIKAPSGALTNEIKAQLKDQKQSIIDFLKGSQEVVDTQSIPIASRENSLPLSFQQQGLWFIDQLEPGSPAYNMPFGFKLLGELDVDALEKAIATIVSRHESLRTSFQQDDEGQPYLNPELCIFKLERHSTVLAEDASIDPFIKEELKREALTSFDLKTPPLIRVSLFRITSPEEAEPIYAVIGCMHHIASDGWSLNVFMRELAVNYASFVSKKECPLPPLKVQYTDFAAWQRVHLSGDSFQRQLDYWVNQLNDLPPLLTLATDRLRPDVQTNNGARYEFKLESEFLNKVLAFCKLKEITPFMALMSAWQIVLSKWANQEKFCVGMPMLGRTKKELEPLIGFFINALLIRADVENNPTGHQIIGRVKETVLGAFSNQDIPLQLILDRLDLQRSLSYQPLAQVGFQLQNFSGSGIASESESDMLNQFAKATNLRMERVGTTDVSSKYDIILSLGQHADHFDGYLEYNTDLFNASTIALMVKHLERAFYWLSEKGGQTLASCELATQDELKNAMGLSCEEILPLTEVQKFILTDSLVNPDSIQNSIGAVVPLDYELDLNALEVAIAQTYRCSSIHRTRIALCDLPYADSAYQVISPTVAPSFQIISISAADEEKASIDQIQDNWVYKSYDVLEQPLLDIALFRREGGRDRIGIRAHHSIYDGLTIAILAKRLNEAYQAALSGADQPTWVDNFAEYVEWNVENINSQSVIEFWSEKLKNVEPLTYSPPAFLSASAPYTIEKCALPVGLKSSITTYCRGHKLHPSDLFRYVYALVLNTYCRAETDFVIHEIHGGRLRGHFDTVGVYYQQIPFLCPAELFKENSTLKDFYEHELRFKQEIKSQRALGLQKQREMLGAGRIGFQFNYYNFVSSEDFGGGEATLTLFSPRVESVVQLIVKDNPENFDLELWYGAHLFDPMDILSRVESIVRQIIEQSVSYVHEIELCLPDETKLFEAWNQEATSTRDESSDFSTIIEWFQNQVLVSGSAIAVQQGDFNLTYSQLNEKANQLAGWLQEQGIGKNDKVALCFGRSIDMLVSVFGVLKSGAAYIPIEATYPIERINYILDDSSVSIVLSQKCLAGKFEDISVSKLFVDSETAVLQQYSVDNLNDKYDPESLIYLIYTSGSTGQPKGAGVRHSGELNLQQWYTEAFAINEKDKSLIVSAFGFDLTQKNLFAVLLKGGTIILPEMEQYDDSIILKAIHDHQVTLVNCAPSAFYPVVELAKSENFEKLSSLRYLILGGEPIRVDALKDWLTLSQCQLVNSYGPTECTDVVSYHVLTKQEFELSSLPIGKPIYHTQLYVLNEALQIVPIGVPGEVCIGGAGVGVGYHNKESLTAECFVDNPHAEGILYKTGDIARYDHSGNLHYIGRKDFQVKLRGLRIELGEIEFALKQLKNVSDALVLVRNDQLIAYALVEESSSESTLISGDWRAALANYLPDYMVPSYMVCLPSWPLTPNGKIDRKALPEPNASERAVPYVAPRTDIEKRLAQIWQDVLKVDRVGIHDSFFELGGHSLLATQVASRARKAFNAHIQLRDLLGEPNIESIAAQVEKILLSESQGTDYKIESISRDERLPLSFVQQQLWILDRLTSGSPAYNMPLAVKLTGKINEAALEIALRTIIQRHEILRSNIVALDGDPQVVIRPEIDFELRKVSVKLGSESLEMVEQRLAADEASTSFDLANDWLIRASRIQIENSGEIESTLLLVTLHHIICDGWSIDVLLKELLEIYLAHQQSRDVNLSPLPVQYVDYAAWQRKQLSGANLDRHLDYWRNQLGNEGYFLELPTDFKRPKTQTINGAELVVPLDEKLSEQLNLLASELGTTLYSVLLTVYATLLSRYANQEQVNIGTPVAGRTHEDVEPLVGFFINALVLKTTSFRHQSIAEIIRQNHDMALEAFDHQELPFEKIIEALNPPRDMSRSAYYQVFFNLLNLPQSTIETPELGVSVIPRGSDQVFAKHELNLYVKQGLNRLVLNLVYNQDLFSQERCKRLLRDFELIAKQVVVNPSILVGDIKLDSVSENLPNPNRYINEVIYEHPLTRFQSIVSNHAVRTAISFGSLSLTYAEVSGLVESNAMSIAKMVDSSPVIAIVGFRRPELAIAMLSTLALNGKFVILDAAYPVERNARVVKTIAPSIMVSAAQESESGLALELSAMVDVPLFYISMTTTQEKLVTKWEDANQCGYYSTTSGTTGIPKVVYSRFNPVMNFISWYEGQLNKVGVSAGRFTLLSGLGHDPLLRDMLTPLFTGGTLYIPTSIELDKPEQLARWVRLQEISVAHLTPAMIEMLYLGGQDILEELGSESELWPALQFVGVGGDRLDYSNVVHLKTFAPKTKVYNFYGATETPQVMAYYEVQEKDAYADIIPIGVPISGVQILVLNADYQLCRSGEVGQIVIQTPYLCEGYVNAEGGFSSADESPSLKGRFYETGDLGRYLDSGDVECLGRKDRQIKIRGFRVELAEIVAVLKECEGVQDACVVLQQLAAPTLAAYIVSTEHAVSESLLQSVQNHAQALLQDYKVPGLWAQIEALPLTPNGKLDIRALPEISETKTQYVAPRSGTEKAIAVIWNAALNAEKISVRDNFFQLGGHSLLATKVVADVKRTLAVDVSLRDVFQNPTIERFALVVDQYQRETSRQLVPIVKSGWELNNSGCAEVVCSFPQSRLWYAWQLNSASTAYNMSVSLRFRGALNVSALESAFRKLIARQASLRTQFASNHDGEPIQKIRQDSSWFELQKQIIDNGPETESLLNEAVSTFRSSPFELDVSPPFKAKLFIVSESDQVLSICKHHIISDGTSMGLMVKELGLLFLAESRGLPAPLPILEFQYPDFAVWQRRTLNDAAVEEQLAFWQSALAAVPSYINLPTDHVRPAQKTGGGDAFSLDFGAELARDVLGFSYENGVTPFVTLASAFAVVIAKYSQQRRFSFGVPTSGRHVPGLENLIGFFINSIILPLDLEGNPEFIQLVKANSTQVMESFANQDIPVDKVYEKLDVGRKASYMPFAQIAFQVTSNEMFQVDALGELLHLLPGVDVTPYASNQKTSRFDITLNLFVGDEQFVANVEYDTDLFERSTIERLLHHIRCVIKEGISNPSIPIESISLVNQQELVDVFSLQCNERFQEVWPLSSMQRDMFVDNMVNVKSLQSSHGWALHVHNALDVELWKECLQKFSDENSILRAKYVAAKAYHLDIGYLAIREKHEIAFNYFDFTSKPKEVDGLVNSLIYRTYNVTEDDLIRFSVVKISEEHFVLVTAVHHAIQDGTALNVMWERLIDLYESKLEIPCAVNADSRFLEHVIHDRNVTDTLEVIEFWTERLAGVEPLDYTVPAPIPPAGRAIRREVFLTDEHWSAVKEYCKSKKVNSALYFKAIFGLLINQYCRPDADFTIQETSSGRYRNHYDAQGCYIQELPFVFDQAALEVDRSFESLLKYSREFQKQTKAMRRISIDKQLEISPKGRVGFMYNYYHFLATKPFLGETILAEGSPSDPANNVQFVVTEVGDRLKLSLYYHPHLFSDFGMLNRIVSASDQIVFQDVQTLGGLQYVTDANEIEYLVHGLNYTTQPFSNIEHCIHQLFERQVDLNPDKLAIADDIVQYSYQQLNRRANQLSHFLVSNGVKVGDLVGLCAERSADFLVGILGIMKAGGAYVPMDPKYPDDRINYMIENSEVPVLLSEASIQGRIGSRDSVKLVLLDDDWEKVASFPETNLMLPIPVRSRAYMIYTSGSTGQPKGAIVRHDGAVNHIEAERLALDFPQAFSFLQTAPSSSDISVWQFLGPVTCGGSVYVLDDVTNAKKLFGLVKGNHVDLVELVPVALQLLMDYVESLPVEDRDLSNLKWMMATGEAVSVDLVNRWLSLYPTIPVVNAYGPTEAADDVIQCIVREPLDSDRRSVPIGKPLANLDVFILDDHLKLVPAGIPGEICIGGIGVGEGYWRNPEKTAAAFILNPFPSAKGTHIYRTGDLGRWLEDGTVEYLDRVDNQVKVRGFRIELGEVEAALSILPEVRECVVVVRDDMPGGAALAAYFVPKSGVDNFDLMAIRARLRETLPEFMVPTALVALEKLPQTPAGKVDRKALPKPKSVVLDEEQFVPAETSTEKKLVEIWESLLPVERIGVTSSFFDLGGHSLLGVRLMSRITQEFGITLPVAELLSAQTVRRLASRLEGFAAAENSEKSLVPLKKALTEPANKALFLIHPVGGDVLCYRDLVDHLEYEGAIYGLRAKGLEGGNVESSLESMVSRYTKAIQEAYPTGVVTLAAQSLGGVIGLKVAQELLAEGRAVDQVLLFDTFTPQVMSEQSKSTIDLIEMAMGITLPESLRLSISQDEAGDWLRELYDMALKAGVLPKDISFDRIRALHHVAVTNHKLVAACELGRIDNVRVTHWEASNRSSGEHSGVGWRSAGAPFQFLSASGDHESMIRGDHAKSLAAQVDSIINNKN